MKAFFLKKYGAATTAFELREVPDVSPGENQVRVEVQAFGLNFADVMARRGMYREAPPLPCVLGYEVCGRITEVGKGVDKNLLGKRVIAFTRFGGYAQQVITPALATIEIPEEWEPGKAVALATQYSTAWYAAIIAANLREGEVVVINSAAGGVGTALMQIARWKKCRICGTTGSQEKFQQIKDSGANEVLNYKSPDFPEKLKAFAGGKGLTLVFDAVGGTTFKKCFRQLSPTGRIVGFGAASRTTLRFFPMLTLAFRFGFMHPALLMMQSKSMIGVNMLRVAENQPQLLRESMLQVVELAKKGVFNPLVGGSYPADKLAQAHIHLESGKSTGKLVITW